MDSDIYLERADTEQAKQKVYALRYRAYRAVEAILPNQQESFSDEYDLLPNISSYLLRKNGGIAVGSIRACMYSPQLQNRIPAFDVYYDEIKTNMGLDKVIVESTRYVVDPDFQTNTMHHSIYLFKAIFLHVALTNADYLIAAVRNKHVYFYKKLLKMVPISDSKLYPNFNFTSAVLLVANAKEAVANAIKNIPVVYPTLEEIREYKQCSILRF